MNALHIIKEASGTLGLNKPDTIEDAKDSNAQRLLSLCNRAIKQVTREKDWQALKCFARFTTDQSAFYNRFLNGYSIEDIAKGFDYFVQAGIIIKTRTKEKIKSATYQEYMLRQSSGACSNRFIELQKHICFLYDPSPTDEYEFIYKSKYPVIGHDEYGDETFKEIFTKDQDECVLDQELVLLCLLMKYKIELGFEVEAQRSDYAKLLNILKDRDEMQCII